MSAALLNSAPLTASEIVEILTFRSGFNTSMVVGGTALLGLAAGVVGAFALLRKRSLLADAVSHATLPGVAIAFLVAGGLGLDGRSLPILLLGAAVSGVIGAGSIHLIVRHSRLNEDAAIGIVLSVFFGAGIVLLSYIQRNAPQGAAGLNSFIYGQAATMLPRDVMLMGSIALVSVAGVFAFKKELSVVCFNDAFARVDGWPVTAIDLGLVGFVVLVTVSGLQAVGLILVVALLIIPPVAARFWTERLWALLLLSGGIGAASGYAGSVISAMNPGRPAGAVIVLTAGALFLISMLAAPSRGVIATGLRRLSLHVKIAGDHLLEAAHERGITVMTRPEVAGVAAERGWSGLFARAISMTLKWRGFLVNGDQGGLALTAKGESRGAQVSRNHALWEQYLISHADIAPNHVDWSVDQVEHALSADLIARLEEALAARGIPLPPRVAGEP